MLNPSDFIGQAKRLDDIDLPMIASTIGCGEDEIHAFMDVEANGSGFDDLGRPKMLFEPHVFYRNLSGAERDKAVSLGLAYPKWKRNYPKDSYPRLKEAMKINEVAALRSASWGLGQILGENSAIVGYANIHKMVLAFMADEENHLKAIVAFLVANNIADDLAAHRWSVVARVYNGPAYAENQYDIKMERAYNKWTGIPDTLWEGEPVKIGRKTFETVRRGSSGETVKTLQQLLIDLGYKLIADGEFGPKTEGQVKLYQARSGLVADGIVGSKTWKALQ